MRISDIRTDRHFVRRLPAPKAAEREALIESIRERGIVVPLVVTEENLLLDGHRRLDAAKEAGLTQVPVRIEKVDGERSVEKALVILTNLRRRHLNEAQRADLGSSLERIERVKAKARQRGGQKKGGYSPKKLGGKRAPQAKRKEQDRATDRVARQVGTSRKTFERVQRPESCLSEDGLSLRLMSNWGLTAIRRQDALGCLRVFWFLVCSLISISFEVEGGFVDEKKDRNPALFLN
jgi:hypothetical protein